MDDQNLLNQVELAAFFRVHRNTITNWIKAGTAPPYVLVKGMRRWQMQDLKEWMEKTKVAPDSEPEEAQ